MAFRYLSVLAALALWGFSVAAAAHDCSRHDDQTHKHCDGDEPHSLYEVELTAPASGSNPVSTSGDCVGITDGAKLDASFPADWSVTMHRFGCGDVDVGGFHLQLISTTVTNTKNERSVELWFTTDCCLEKPSNRTLYKVGPLVDMVMEPQGASFQIVLDALDTPLVKTGPPNKGTTLGLVSIGTMVYTEIP